MNTEEFESDEEKQRREYREKMDKEIEKDNKKMRDFLDRNIKYESQLERYFARKVEEAGGWSVKFNSIGTNGLPDRIVFYMGMVWLVELKTPKGRLSPIQEVIHKKFKRHRFNVRVVRDKEQVTAFINEMIQIIL
jgi:hypothetical protein